MCSPFGKHNTQQLHKYLDKNPNRKCKSCGRNYIYEGKNNKPGHRKTICNSCRATVRAQKRKLQAVEYKGGCCEKCSYDKSVKALCFHHLDGELKFNCVSQLYSYTWETLKKEIDKCQLLCLNCHAEQHEILYSRERTDRLDAA